MGKEWYDVESNLFSEHEFAEIAVERGFKRIKAVLTFEALYYDWRWEDRYICREFLHTHCLAYGCDWRRTCDGLHYIRFGTFATCRVVTTELLAIPRRTVSGNHRPHYTEERIELLREVRDAARDLYVDWTGVPVDLRRAA